MTYYIVSMRGTGKHYVVFTAGTISRARQRITEEIAYDLKVWGYTDGYCICTGKSEKEYHSISILNDKPYTLYTAKGAKMRAELSQAITEHKAQYETA